MRPIIKIIEGISETVSGYLQGFVLCVLMALILVEVATRYVMQNPLSVAEEYGGYMLVAITYIGLAYTWKKRTHVRVEFLVEKMPRKVRLVLRLVTLVMAAVFSVFMVVASVQLVQESFMFGDRSGSWLRTPLAWPQMVLILGSVLLFLQLFVEVIKAVHNIKTGEED